MTREAAACAPFGPGCPWYGALQAYGPANLKWCEERVCAWINEPANAWSNLAYLLAGFWILSDARRRPSRPGALFGGLVLAMGALSFLYHATNNFLTQALDFLGMFLVVFFIIAANAVRAGWCSRRAAGFFYGAACAGATAALRPLDVAGFAIQWLIAMAAAAIVLTELLARAREPSPGPMGAFWAAAAVLAAAEACSLADLGRLWCDPANHRLQGHAAWHLLSALGLALAYRHLAGPFDRAWGEPAGR